MITRLYADRDRDVLEVVAGDRLARIGIGRGCFHGRGRDLLEGLAQRLRAGGVLSAAAFWAALALEIGG